MESPRTPAPAEHSGWIGVDFDGTLAYYVGWKGHEFDQMGPPIPAMMARVKAWLAEGRQVKIFTARAGIPEQIPAVAQWLEVHGLGGMEITNIKDRFMYQLWDDRAIQVEINTGREICDARAPVVPLDAPTLDMKARDFLYRLTCMVRGFMEADEFQMSHAHELLRKVSAYLTETAPVALAVLRAAPKGDMPGKAAEGNALDGSAKRVTEPQAAQEGEALVLREGATYRNKKGDLVGPMRPWTQYYESAFYEKLGNGIWLANGEYVSHLPQERENDLVAEVEGAKRLGEPLGEPENDTCDWQLFDEDSDGWKTGCGHEFCVAAGKPGQDEWKFCHCCSKPIREMVVCGPCSESGGAGMDVVHAAPACPQEAGNG